MFLGSRGKGRGISRVHPLGTTNMDLHSVDISVSQVQSGGPSVHTDMKLAKNTTNKKSYCF